MFRICAVRYTVVASAARGIALEIMYFHSVAGLHTNEYYTIVLSYSRENARRLLNYVLY